MNNDRFTQLRLALALVGLTTAGFGFAPGAHAQDAASSASTSPAAAAAEDPEARIKSLHDQLKITSDEEGKWKKFADVMRDNSEKMRTMIEDRAQKADSVSAVDDMKSYAKVAEEHAEGMKKLLSAFEPLYSAMPKDQQQNADAVFAHKAEQAQQKMDSEQAK
jgi:hypothetical protein